MLKRRWVWVESLVVMTIVVCGGCSSPSQNGAEMLMAKPSLATYDEPFAYMEEPFVYMKDNAMRHQASISDLHFVPNTTELNGLGVAYLDRLTKLHAPYGGTVRYATNSTDEEFVATRLAHLTDYLEATGADMDRITVVAAMPGGRGMRAAEALNILAGKTGDEDVAERMQISK